MSVKSFLFVMKSAFLVGYLNIPNPISALTGFKNWSRKTLFYKVDLCTQSCYSEIVPGLYLSNARAAADRNVLRHLNITHVLTVETHRLPKSTFHDTDISTLYIRAFDTPQTNLMAYFPMSNAFIDKGLRKGKVLVHCHFGVSRSATLIIAYIMKKYKLTYDQAFIFVKQRRRFINPNPGFVRQLKEYEGANYNVNAYHKLEAFMNVNARKHKYRLATLAAVVLGVIVPLAVLIA